MDVELPDDHLLPGVEQLFHLLDLLNPPTVSGLPSFGLRQRSPGLRRVLEQARRIAANSRSREQVAVTEYHIGLYQFQWQEWSGAMPHFERAREEALRANNRRLSCLALFAAGCMRQRNYDFEGALAIFSEVEGKIRAMRRLLGVRGFDERENREHIFLDELEEVLEQAQRYLKMDLEQEVTKRLEGSAAQRMPLSIPVAEEMAAPDAWTPQIQFTRQTQQTQPPRINLHAAPAATDELERTPVDDVSGNEEPVARPSHTSLVTAVQPRPHPYYFQLRGKYDLFCVLSSADRGSPARVIRPQDWLMVSRRHSRYEIGDLVVVGATRENVFLAGSTQVAEDCAHAHGKPIMFLGRVEGRDAQSVTVITGAADSFHIGPEQPLRVGKVVGFFRYLGGPGQQQPASREDVQAPAAGCEQPPDPRYFLAAEGIALGCVAGSVPGAFWPEIEAGDWLLVDTRVREFMEHDAVLVSGDEVGGTLVNMGPAQAPAMAFVGEFMPGSDAGSDEVRVAEDGRVRITPERTVGAVIGFFRHLTL